MIGLRSLLYIPLLEIVQVSGDIPDVGLMYLSRHPSLKVLDVTSELIGDGGLAVLTGMASLESLSVFDGRITDGGLEHLKSMKSLKHLCIQRRGKRFSPLAVVELQQALPGCELTLFQIG